MGNCYYISFVKCVSRIPLQLIGHTYCSLSSPKKAVDSLGGSILDQFICINSTSTTYSSKSSIYKWKLAAGKRKTKTTTTTMVHVHRRHSAMIHIAPALITKTRGLCRHPSLTMGGYYREGATQFTMWPHYQDDPILFTWHIHVFVVWFNYLRHVRFSSGPLYPSLVHVLTCHFICFVY